MSKRSFTFFNLKELALLAVEVSTACVGFLLWSFVSFNVQPVPLIDPAFEKKLLAETKYIEYNHPAFSEDIYARQLEKLGVSLHPGSEFTQEQIQPTPRSLNHCKSLAYRTLKSLPPDAVSQLKHLTLHFSNEGRRGLGGGSTIIIRCPNEPLSKSGSGFTAKDKEFVGVLVHEMGHITDTGLMSGNAESGPSEFLDGDTPVWNDDPSLGFYRLSFINESKRKVTSSEGNFVSIYASTDPYEDFAETYNFYIHHGDEFRQMKKADKILQKKYDFMKNKVFYGEEFFNGAGDRKVELTKRDYDVTVLPYDIKRFFVI